MMKTRNIASTFITLLPSIRALFVRKPIDPSPSWRDFLGVVVTLAWFALSAPAPAVDPPPDGGYGNGNTAEVLLRSRAWQLAPTTLRSVRKRC